MFLCRNSTLRQRLDPTQPLSILPPSLVTVQVSQHGYRLASNGCIIITGFVNLTISQSVTAKCHNSFLLSCEKCVRQGPLLYKLVVEPEQHYGEVEKCGRK